MRHQKRMNPVHSVVAVIALLGGLAACGSNDDSGASPVGNDAATDSSTNDATPEDAPPGGSSTGVASLSSRPIAWAEVFRPGAAPSAAPEDSAPSLAECPLLSSASLAAAISSNSLEQPTLREATTTACTWSGSFTNFEVTTEPAADVDVDDHSGRGYNLDVEPVVDTQDGPGEKAVLLTDTAFADTEFNDGTPYAYFFVIDGQAVTLRMTALPINDDGWRPMADEVAAAITEGTAGLAAPPVETPAPTGDESAAAPVVACEYLTVDDVGQLFGVDPSTVTVQVQTTGQVSGCTWDAESGAVLNIFGYSSEETFDEYPDFNSGAEDISSAVGAPAYRRGNDAVVFVDDVSGDFTITYVVDVGTTPGGADTEAALINVMSRLGPPD